LPAQQVWSVAQNDPSQTQSVGASITIYHADRTSPGTPDPIPSGAMVYLQPSEISGRLWISGAPGWQSLLAPAAMRDQPGCRDF
jgi:hypothetical protein